MTNKEEYFSQAHKNLLTKIRKLKINSDIFGEAFMNDVRPRWYKIYKDGEFRILIVNRAYTEKTGITLPAYYMKCDDEIWDKSIANAFGVSDMDVIKSRIRVSTENEVINPLTGKEEIWVGFKSPRFDIKNNIIGIHGQADIWDKEIWESVPSIIKKVIKLEY